ncbi:hypothetical protein MKX67_12475 [Cytobacillus sp. FSL W7-1323]|uniref:Uncharacterized protein n=1 Tax=Cytobacillus kochii TaxID=859143 RepID=A0A248TN57_9BACI|nr:hypothetical protein [Cytobacillus kochii]ASV69592.1 hypothetical protein CKF48_21145 [Cytobacillus kochii]MDQ0184386.1 hypothetical protein [Cytobacillus kochii]
MLQKTGFTDIQTFKLWETRNTYTLKETLLEDIKARSGRSILHELDDVQLERLVEYIDKQLGDKKIVESDRWTMWLAKK